MSDSIIQQIQKDISTINSTYSQIIHNQDDLYESIFIFSITLVIAIIYISYTAYIRGRDSERGRIEGRLESLDSIVKEQEHITNTVETIKTDIEKGVWLEKEKNAIKRQKVAEMVGYLSEINSYLFSQLSELVSQDGKLDDKNNPISKLLDISLLYFDLNEIEGTQAAYELHQEISNLYVEYTTRKAKHIAETQQHLPIDIDFLKKYKDTVSKYIEPLAELRSFLGNKMTSLLEEQ